MKQLMLAKEHSEKYVHMVVVKVIDILGNDTTKVMEVEIT